MSNVISHLLVEGNISVIPDSINDFLCLLPLSIRKLRDDGGVLELGSEDCQQTLMSFMQELIHKKDEEERTDIDILAKVNFTHPENTQAFNPDYAVTPEEIMEAITMLCRLNKQNVAKFLGQCMGLIGDEEAKAVQRHHEITQKVGWDPADQWDSSTYPSKKAAFVETLPNAVEDLEGPGIKQEHFPLPQYVNPLEDGHVLALPNAVESDGEDVSPPPIRGPQRASRLRPREQSPPLLQPHTAEDEGKAVDFKGILPEALRDRCSSSSSSSSRGVGSSRNG
eukprot:CAMPEP_0172843854 /NCGR_PEP_ID=MMETSP1075-20121228/31780_1 /TAXON_ID=2916 /ORGANISM="Ceratium fusus, Strain PA161109" /LENGTH=280 /DNA_ID=CAMNT_0013688187 /DNA_START=75 /DNA_END=915 /DNA_ORIENTATION=+